MRHLIQKQHIEILAEDTEQARQVQNQLDGFYRKKILPLIEQVFTRYSRENTRLHFDKLELNLGELPYDNFEIHFIEALQQVLPESLEQRITDISYSQPQSSEMSMTAMSQSRLDQLHHFLLTGMLPWWSTDQAVVDLDNLFFQVLEEAPDGVQVLLDALPKGVIERISKQFSAQVHQQLLQMLLISSEQQRLQQVLTYWHWLKHIAEPFYTFPDASEIRKNVLTALLNRRIAKVPQGSSKEALNNILSTFELDAFKELTIEKLLLLQWLVKRTPADTGVDKQIILLRLEQAHPIVNRLETLITQGIVEKTGLNTAVDAVTLRKMQFEISNIVENYRVGTLSIGEVQLDAGIHKKQTENKLSGNHRQEQEGTELAHEKTSPAQKEYEQSREQKASVKTDRRLEKVLYVHNAGLILLWPFLSRYFQTIGLLEGKQFVSISHQERAVLLTHYLQTDETHVYEHRLLLNKLLCGWPVDMPLMAEIELHKVEKKESKKLLQTVIQHWQVLKNTSVDGFRQTFLGREGRLEEKNHGWELFITRTGYDVLLDKLPWGVSTVYLPWMKKTVFVEW